MSIRETQNIYNLLGRLNYGKDLNVKTITEPNTDIANLLSGIYHIVGAGSVNCINNTETTEQLLLENGYLFLNVAENADNADLGNYFCTGYLTYTKDGTQQQGNAWAIGKQVSFVDNIKGVYDLGAISFESENVNYKVSDITADLNDNFYPNVPAVINYVKNYQSQNQGGLIYHTVLTEGKERIDITADSLGNSFNLNNYYLILKIPANPSLIPISYIRVALSNSSNVLLGNARNDTIIRSGMEGNYHMVIMEAKIHNNRWEYSFGTTLDTFLTFNGARPDRMGYIENNSNYMYNQLLCAKLTLTPTGTEEGKLGFIPANTIIELYGS